MKPMEIIITTDAIIKATSLITALGVIGGVVAWCITFPGRQKQQDKDLKAIRAENTLICCGILACLKRLKEQGCNGPATVALDKLKKHLNNASHQMEDV